MNPNPAPFTREELEQIIAEVEAEFAKPTIATRKELSGDWWPNPDCLIPIGDEDVEE